MAAGGDSDYSEEELSSPFSPEFLHGLQLVLSQCSSIHYFHLLLYGHWTFVHLYGVSWSRVTMLTPCLVSFCYAVACASSGSRLDEAIFWKIRTFL